ncbi:MAG: hypothetical protein WCZ11_05270 [Bacilli bacterium]|jgi:hypothetical protein
MLNLNFKIIKKTYGAFVIPNLFIFDVRNLQSKEYISPDNSSNSDLEQLFILQNIVEQQYDK